MRKATQDKGIIVIDGQFIGISLGRDYCAEHEWGIKELRSRFGLREGNIKCMGIENRLITKNVDNMVFLEEIKKKQKFAILYTGYTYRTLEETQKDIPRDLKNYKEDIAFNEDYYKRNPPREPKDPIACAWDESSFGIGVMGETAVGYLKELYQAFQEKNVVITFINLMPGNPFSNVSLSLLIADRIPLSAGEQMYDADEEHYKLIEYEKKIGMTKLKEKNRKSEGLHYYLACSAKWIDYENEEAREEIKKKLNTKYDIRYWINYSDNDNNYGYYTVEDIKKWLTGKKTLLEVKPKAEKKPNGDTVVTI
jgi:hypothetical protein